MKIIVEIEPKAQGNLHISHAVAEYDSTEDNMTQLKEAIVELCSPDAKYKAEIIRLGQELALVS